MRNCPSQRTRSGRSRRTEPRSTRSRNPVDIARRSVHSWRSYGTHRHRRTNAPGSIPVELRRARVHTRPTPRSRGSAGTTGACQSRQSRLALVAPTFSPERQRSARPSNGLEPVVAPRSPTPTAGGSTPSEPAHAPGIQSGHQHLDNCRDIVVEASATWPRRGSVAPGPRRASRLTGRAPGSYPGRDWVRGPGRAPLRRYGARCRRSSTGQSSCPSSSRSRVRVPSVARLPTIRRGREVDVAQWTRRRSTNPEDAGSTPAVDTSSP